MNITVIGASGFIGNKLLPAISSDYTVRGLSRSKRESADNFEWVAADLFSYQSTLDSLVNTDIAIYLVHSMIPASRLFQGSFQDTDLLLADNFARACIKNEVKQIIYLGGLAPTGKTSKHLQSRIEVEKVFQASGIATTVLRAGMVVGDGGSSFEILKNLVFNLPAMILPSWTQNSTQTVYVDDLVKVLKFCINNKAVFNRTLNVVNGEKINYENLIRIASKYFNKSKFLISIPINYTYFSKLWVKIFGQADYELVSPLIDSLVCDLNYPNIPNEIENIIEYRSFRKMLDKVPKKKRTKKKKEIRLNKNTVRSIQRLSNRNDLDVLSVSKAYTLWLPKYLKNIISIKWSKNTLGFYMLGLSLPLLKLEKQNEQRELDRVKFHIVGGLLTKSNTGWLEFRKVLGLGYTLVSINEFEPSLPWYFYKYTQAILHKKVMLSFGKFLEKN